MAGFSLRARETTLLREIAVAARVPSDLPLPWDVLERLRELLRADSVGFICLDSTAPRMVFQQFIEPWGERGCESESLDEARDNPFWAQYWGPLGCSYPDDSGDYRYVRRASDHLSAQELREKRARSGAADEPWRGYLEGCLPGRSPGRYFRIAAYRGGRDFDERDLFCVQLLQPHIERSFWASAAAARDRQGLTPRQMEVLRMVRAGLSNRQIARRTGLSEGTVHTHLTNVFGRLGVGSRSEAVHRVFDTSEDWAVG